MTKCFKVRRLLSSTDKSLVVVFVQGMKTGCLRPRHEDKFHLVSHHVYLPEQFVDIRRLNFHPETLIPGTAVGIHINLIFLMPSPKQLSAFT